MNQRDRILLSLRQNTAVCGTLFLGDHMPRYSARIRELKELGHNIQTRPCRHPWHTHSLSNQIEYLLLDEGRMF